MLCYEKDSPDDRISSGSILYESNREGLDPKNFALSHSGEAFSKNDGIRFDQWHGSNNTLTVEVQKKAGLVNGLYDVYYGDHKTKQAEKLKAMMQIWVDKVIETTPEYAGCTIDFIYDANTDQFKSTMSRRSATTDAKIWNVVVKAKPVPNVKPSVDLSNVNMMQGSTQKISLSLGSGNSGATEAAIRVQDEQIVSVNTRMINAGNLADSLVLNGLKVSDTVVEITFNDPESTKITIPIKVKQKPII